MNPRSILIWAFVAYNSRHLGHLRNALQAGRQGSSADILSPFARHPLPVVTHLLPRNHTSALYPRKTGPLDSAVSYQQYHASSG